MPEIRITLSLDYALPEHTNEKHCVLLKAQFNMCNAALFTITRK